MANVREVGTELGRAETQGFGYADEKTVGVAMPLAGSRWACANHSSGIEGRRPSKRAPRYSRSSSVHAAHGLEPGELQAFFPRPHHGADPENPGPKFERRILVQS